MIHIEYLDEAVEHTKGKVMGSNTVTAIGKEQRRKNRKSIQFEKLYLKSDRKLSRHVRFNPLACVWRAYFYVWSFTT